MKIVHYSFIRALFAIATGALIVQYKEEMVTWMTMLIGVLFFLSGLIAIIMAYSRKRAAKKLYKKMQESNIDMGENYKMPNTKLNLGSVIAGIGSMLLGVTLATMPQTFVEFLVYILSAFLLLGAAQQFFTLATARSFGKVGFGWWIMPTLLFAAGCLALFKPSAIASFPLLFIGCSMIVYGIVECINSLKASNNRKHAEVIANNNSKPDFSDAEVVSFEEVK